jgi:RNA polymerase sigma factor (sigma-70 family)
MEVEPTLTAKGIRDYQLIKAAIEGKDQHAYAELMGLYWDTIYFMLLKMSGNREDAEDLAIETFAKAFGNLSQYTSDYAFSTWLFRIATNHCIDFIRKRKKNVLSKDGNEDLSNPEKLENLQESSFSPDESMIRGQKVVVIRQVVDRLKPRYQKLVRLRYFDEKSYEEIAVELNLPLGTVKAQLFRARELLYKILDGTQDRI